MSGLASPPLVTFALVTYNQVAYVRAAVEAAFGQEYPRLQIVISDDCSTDGTFDVLKDLVGGYDGPHEVILRQTAANRGSLLHVKEVAAVALGDLIVLAAGDDVSSAKRTRVLANAWQETGAWAMCSRYDLIDESGALISRSVSAPVLQSRTFRRYLYEEDGPIKVVHGCTSAYAREVFDCLQNSSDDYILAEDGALTVLVNLMGKKIVHLEDSLVGYRVSRDSLTNSRRTRQPTLLELRSDEERIARFARAQANRCRLFLRMNEYLGPLQVRRLQVENVERDLAYEQVKADWWTYGFWRRLHCVATYPWSSWMVGRLFGLKIFLSVKWIVRRIPRGSVPMS